MEISKGRRGGVWRDKEKKEKHEEREREIWKFLEKRKNGGGEKRGFALFFPLSVSNVEKRETRSGGNKESSC